MATNWQIGDKIQDRWEIHKMLKGGMGIVYVVYDLKVHEPFAAKTFQDEVFARNPQIADRFTQEGLAWVNLDVHQNVTQARMVQQIEGKPFLFLEYVSGGDLSGWIGTPRLTEDLPQVLRFAIQFCDGMTHALAKGIKAHRDVKPQNCLITEESTLKVTDFGLAKVFDDAVSFDRETPNAQSLSVGLSRTGRAAGTPTHMAPEQFDDAKHVDVRADIYSFGVMLFEMITGQWPFVGRTWREFERLHKTQPLPPLTTQHSALRTIVETCLAKDPAHRFTDFREARERLAEIYGMLTGEPAPQPVVGAELDAMQWNNKGAALGELGRHAESVPCYDRALELNPQFADAWSNKGVALLELGQHEEALACYDRAIALNPNNPTTWSNKGNSLNHLKRHEEALACLERALEFDRRYVDAWFNKAVTLGKLGRTEEELVCYDRVLALSPRDADAWNNKGVVLRGLERHKEALACYDHALNHNPRHEYAWANKGTSFRALERFEEALPCYERALAVNSSNEGASWGMGLVLYRLGRHEEAIACYDRVLALKASNEEASVYVYKGISLAELGRREDALICYDRALALNPRDEQAWRNKGHTLAVLGRVHEALGCFEEGQRLGDPLAAEGIAACRQILEPATSSPSKSGDETLSKKESEGGEQRGGWLRRLFGRRGVSMAQEAAELFDKALALADSQRWEEAIACYDHVLEIDLRGAEAWVNKGWALYNLGRKEEAIACCDRALELNPRYAQAWMNKGCALGDISRLSEALGCFEEAQRLGHAQAAEPLALCRRMLQKEKRQLACVHCGRANDSSVCNPDYHIQIRVMGRYVPFAQCEACFNKLRDSGYHVIRYLIASYPEEQRNNAIVPE